MNGPREPFGFKYNEETKTREPIELELAALEQAKMYIHKGCTMRSTRDWLVKKTGRDISIPGLLKAIGYVKTSE